LWILIVLLAVIVLLAGMPRMILNNSLKRVGLSIEYFTDADDGGEEANGVGRGGLNGWRFSNMDMEEVFFMKVLIDHYPSLTSADVLSDDRHCDVVFGCVRRHSDVVPIVVVLRSLFTVAMGL